MSDKLTLTAEARTEFGKGFARRARMAGKIPAVLYGHGSDPLHVVLPGHETMLALKHSNALLTISVDGENHLAIAKDVQRDAVRNVIEHVDLLTVQKGEQIAVTIPVHVVGESAPGTMHVVEASQGLHVMAEATNIPEAIEISVEGLAAGTTLRGVDLTLPAGVTLAGDPEETVVSVKLPQSTSDEEGEGVTSAAPEASEEA